MQLERHVMMCEASCIAEVELATINLELPFNYCDGCIGVIVKSQGILLGLLNAVIYVQSFPIERNLGFWVFTEIEGKPLRQPLAGRRSQERIARNLNTV